MGKEKEVSVMICRYKKSVTVEQPNGKRQWKKVNIPGDTNVTRVDLLLSIKKSRVPVNKSLRLREPVYYVSKSPNPILTETPP